MNENPKPVIGCIIVICMAIAAIATTTWLAIELAKYGAVTAPAKASGFSVKKETSSGLPN